MCAIIFNYQVLKRNLKAIDQILKY